MVFKKLNLKTPYRQLHFQSNSTTPLVCPLISRSIIKEMTFRIHHIPIARGLRSSGVRNFHSSSRCFSSTQSLFTTTIHRPRSRASAKESSSSHACGATQSRSHSGCGCRPAVSQTKTAYIALGSNLGDRISEIEKACNEMNRRGIRVKRTSSLWETEPMYVTDQDRFINGACEVGNP